MKTKGRKYFFSKLDILREELRSEIIMLLFLNFNSRGESIKPLDFDSSTIEFEKLGSDYKIKELPIKDIRYCENTVVIYPANKKYSPYSIMDIMNIHDLLMIHSIISENIVT